MLARDDAADGAAPESEFRKELRECAPEGRRDMLADHIGALASAVMGLAPPQRWTPPRGSSNSGWTR